jgi:translation initiation factor 1
MIYTFKRTYDLQIRKRKGKVTTVIEGYEGSDADFKILAKEIKTKLSGTFKDDSIIQGDYRDKIMEILKLKASKLNVWEVNKECQSVLVFT